MNADGSASYVTSGVGVANIGTTGPVYQISVPNNGSRNIALSITPTDPGDGHAVVPVVGLQYQLNGNSVFQVYLYKLNTVYNGSGSGGSFINEDIVSDSFYFVAQGVN